MDPVGVDEAAKRNAGHRQASGEPAFPFRNQFMSEIMQKRYALAPKPRFPTYRIGDIDPLDFSSLLDHRITPHMSVLMWWTLTVDYVKIGRIEGI
ncbi:MAG: hypothetical protein WAN65_25035 [Candidatus Sulfotelmatobacter sp.]